MVQDGKKIAAGLGVVALVTTAIILVTRAVKAAPPPGLASVRGTVRDEVTRQPLAEVSVTINGYGAYTNENGGYEIINIIPGTYDIAFSKAGYYPAGWTLPITAGTYRISYVLYPIS